jgi:HEAT repeat protein
MEQATSRSLADVRGKKLTELFPEIERRGLVAPFRRVLEQGVVELLSPALHGYLIACAPVDPTPRFRYMQQRAIIAPLRDGDEITGLVVTIEDVTSRRDEERQELAGLASGDWRTRRQAADRILEEPGDTLVTELIGRLRLEHRDPGLLNSLLPLLASGALETLKPLTELTTDADPEVRMYASQALGNLKDRRAIPALLALLRDSDVNVKYHAIESIAKLRASEAADALARIAESREFYLAFAALDALSAIGESRVAPRIVALLEDDTIRPAAISTLAQLADDTIVPPLVAMFENAALTSIVAEALITLHQRYTRQFDEGDYVIDLVRRNMTAAGAQNLLSALNTTSGKTLHAVVRVLGWIGGQSVITELTRLLGSPALRSEVIEAFVRHAAGATTLLAEQLQAEDLETRRAALTAIGRIGNPESVPQLIRVLSDPDLTVDAAGALARIGDPRGYDALLPLLADDRAAVRRAAIGALNSIGHPRMPEDVRRMFADRNPRIRESAVRIAGYFGYPECSEVLLHSIHDADENVRRAAVENLPNLDEALVLPVLKTAIRDESAKIRAAAAQSLGHLESVSAVPDLLRAMTDSDTWVRYYTARALGRIRSPESMDVLANALRSDPANQVRIAAADALGSIGGRRTVSLLAPYVNSEDHDLSQAALMALGVVGHPDAFQPILSALRSSEPEQRLVAVRAMAARRDQEAVEALQWAASAESNEAVAEAAIEELARMATPDSIASLLRIASDRRLRERVIDQISRLGRTHLNLIKAGLSNPQLETRRAVVEALGRMKNPEASEALITALDDERAEVRLAALLALRRLGSQVPHRKLWNIAQNDPDAGVREAAAQGLQGNV